MSEFDDDWRLRGQENFLRGKTLHRSTYKQRSETWDHDHCAFCWAKFMERDYPGYPANLHVGYTTEDEYHWICEQCFCDFRDRFEWHLREDVN